MSQMIVCTVFLIHLTAGMCVIPDIRQMAPVSPLTLQVLCPQTGPSSPPDPSQQSNGARQRLKVSEYTTGPPQLNFSLA